MKTYKFTIVVQFLLLNFATANAAVPAAPFQVLGHIEKFSVDNPADVLSAAHITVNGIDILLPKNLVVQMPAAYLTPQQIFQGPNQAGVFQAKSGLALSDRAAVDDPPYAAFEAAIDGNIVKDPADNKIKYIAGLMRISQQSLNLGAGYIKSIDANTGELRIGEDPSTPVSNADARVLINDPEGRYGPKTANSDKRFSVDTDNPTVHALTGYPMCVPVTSNAATCPKNNRPLTDSTQPANSSTNPFLSTFVMMPPPGLPAPAPGIPVIPGCKPSCDPEQQAPLAVGDYITYQGTLAKDTNPTLPFFISAHTVVAQVGIYTEPGNGNRAYVSLEDSLLGTLGSSATCGSTAECQDRIKIEGFTSDPTKPVGVYFVDIAPTGKKTVRRFALASKPQGVFGRFRFIVGKNAGVLEEGKGAPREIMVRLDDNGPLADGAAVPTAPTTANGLVAGQYVAPIGEYIFPESVILGMPVPELNFQCLSFLTAGWGLPDLPTLGQLAPWPGAVQPAANASGISCRN